MKIIKDENELIDHIEGEENKKDAIAILQNSNSIFFLILPAILSLVIVFSMLSNGIAETLHYNKWFFIAILLNSLLQNLNKSAAIEEVIKKYNKELKYKKSLLEKIDFLIIVLLVLSFIFLI